MYVRDAKNRDEVWLLDHIEEMGLDDAGFRSRDYVLAVDEETNERAGFGRIRIHKTDEGEVCELTSVGVLPAWRDQGVGAHVVERLLEKAGDQSFETLYALTSLTGYLAQFGFDPVDTGSLPEKLTERLATKRADVDGDAVALRIGVDEFRMPPRLRERFKHASPMVEPDAVEGPEENPEDFGIDSENATYKYDTGR
jgi:N-acetylglutamate synthase-like GNAT family acetyltransferase